MLALCAREVPSGRLCRTVGERLTFIYSVKERWIFGYLYLAHDIYDFGSLLCHLLAIYSCDLLSFHSISSFLDFCWKLPFCMTDDCLTGAC